MGIVIAYHRVEHCCQDALTLRFGDADVLIVDVNAGRSGLALTPDDHDGFLVQVQMTDLPRSRCWIGEEPVQLGEMSAGSVVIHDLREGLHFVSYQETNTILIRLSRSAFRHVIADSGAGWRDALRTRVVTQDAVIYNLVVCMLPELSRFSAGTGLFVEHLIMALSAHIASNYLVTENPTVYSRGGLAGWQLRKAQDLLTQDLTDRIELTDVATKCGLSVSHFSRSFRQSMGQTPHNWLIGRRVDSAKTMLRESGMSLAEIALNCGFADQSHFTRIFSREVGASPGIWRRSFSAPASCSVSLGA